MQTGILYQLLSMFSFGAGNVVWKIPQKTLGVFKIITIRTIVTVLLIGTLMVFNNAYNGTLNDWLFAILISAISFLGLAFYNLSLKTTTVSQSITVTSAGALFGVITSIIAYGEKPSWKLLIALVLIVVSLFFIENKKPIFKWSKGTFYALLAAFFWGTTFALFRIPAESIGSINFSFVLELTVLCCAIIALVFTKPNKPNEQPTLKTYLTVILIGCLGFLGVVFYNKAVVLIDVSTLSVMGAFTPIISIIISHIVLKERFNTLQYVGMLFTLIAVVMLSL